jgi:hypothetical protein
MISLHSKSLQIIDLLLMALIMVTIKEEANTLKVSLTMFSSIGIGVMYQTVMA